MQQEANTPFNLPSNMRLEGQLVELEPLRIVHVESLQKAAADGALWNLWYTYIPTFERTTDYIQNALQAKEKGDAYPFIVKHRHTGQIVGTTRYMHIDAPNRRLEIGHTWYAKSFQHTGVNIECKYLLLEYAFEQLQCIAVEFRTNWHNHASREAILRLGAKQDGVLRNHRLSDDGIIRDTVVFSIIESEWSSVKKALLFRLKKYL